MSADLLVRVMAFVGTVVAGAFLLGWLAQLVAKLAFNQAVPRWPLWGVRTLGGVLCGFVAFWWLFGSGGFGMGGSGNGFSLGGKGKGAGEQADAKKQDDKPKPKDDRTKKDTRPTGPRPSPSLSVEVLGDTAAQQVAVARSRSFDAKRRYRLDRQGELQTLEEVKQEVRRRRALEPPLARLEIVVYLDSPDAGTSHVAALKEWAHELHSQAKPMKVDLSNPGSNAPLD